MNTRIQYLIDEIDSNDQICTAKIIKDFEKKIKKKINRYNCKTKLEDYKINYLDYTLNYLDYIVLYYIWKNCDLHTDIEDILVIMYSFYKLEEFYFDSDIFNLKKPLYIINNSNINFLIVDIFNILYTLNE